MTPFADLIQQGSAHAWLFIPSAILLGALHGLEPGHSKTMMAAFIIAIRGTVRQAILLGVAATLSHTAIVWIIALAGQYFGQQWGSEANEPYFQLASAAIIIAVALWMLWRTWRDQNPHDHSHHHDEVRMIDTGHGVLKLEIFEDGQPPHWRLTSNSGHGWDAKDVLLKTIREDGGIQTFKFAQKNGYLESVEQIPEPHGFKVKLVLSHGSHSHDYKVEFQEHDHGHADEDSGLNVAEDGEVMDAHARAHAKDIQRRFANQNVTTGQIIMFGLTGGLIPCPAAITVLLLCLQLKQISLGVVLVMCFSIGLAVTMVSAGVIAALSVKHAASRFPWFSTFARRAPYASSAVIILVGLYMAWQGWMALALTH